MKLKMQNTKRKTGESMVKLFVPIVLSVVMFSFLMPVFVFAQPGPDDDLQAYDQYLRDQGKSDDGGIGSDDPNNAKFQLIPCNEVTIDANGKSVPGIPCNFVALVATFNRILKFLLYLSIPLVVGIILYTGFQFLTAGGDAMKLEKAKKMLVPVAIGIFWVLASWLIVSTILKTFLSTDTQTELKKNTEFEKLLK